MYELHRSWGRKVRDRRIALGRTQEQLAEASGIDQSLISRIENGKCPSDEQKYRLAAALGLTPDLLFPYDAALIPALPKAASE